VKGLLEATHIDRTEMFNKLIRKVKIVRPEVEKETEIK